VVANIFKRGDMYAIGTLLPRGSIGRGRKSSHDPQKGSVTAPHQHTAGFTEQMQKCGSLPGEGHTLPSGSAMCCHDDGLDVAGMEPAQPA